MKRRPHYSKEEFGRCGDGIYERGVRRWVETGDEQEFVVIEIDRGINEVDEDELAASDRPLARNPDAQLGATRVGSRDARRFGLHSR